MEDNMFIRRIFCIQRPVSRKMNCLSDNKINNFYRKVSVLSGGFLSFIVIFLVLQINAADGYNIRSTVSGCHHNGTVFGEGSMIPTLEPCLSCKCSNKTLICSLRICPEQPIPPPRGCILVHRNGSCCPHLSCTKFNLIAKKNTDRRVISFESQFHKYDHTENDGILNGNNNLRRSEIDEDIEAEYGVCIHEGTIYKSGSAMTSSSLCSYCYCIAGKQKCVKPKCLLPSHGCQPVFTDSTCCPIRYDCSGKNFSPNTIPKIDNKHYLRDTTRSPRSRGCLIDSYYYPEGQKLPKDPSKPCDICYCIRGAKRCTPKKCAPSIRNCLPIIPKGECCAASYSCDHKKNETPRLLDTSDTPRQFDFFSMLFGSDNSTDGDPDYPDEQMFSTAKPPVLAQTVSTTENSFFDKIKFGLDLINENGAGIENILDTKKKNGTLVVKHEVPKEESFLDIILGGVKDGLNKTSGNESIVNKPDDDDDDDDDDEGSFLDILLGNSKKVANKTLTDKVVETPNPNDNNFLNILWDGVKEGIKTAERNSTTEKTIPQTQYETTEFVTEITTTEESILDIILGDETKTTALEERTEENLTEVDDSSTTNDVTTDDSFWDILLGVSSKTNQPNDDIETTDTQTTEDSFLDILLGNSKSTEIPDISDNETTEVPTTIKFVEKKTYSPAIRNNSKAPNSIINSENITYVTTEDASKITTTEAVTENTTDLPESTEYTTEEFTTDEYTTDETTTEEMTTEEIDYSTDESETTTYEITEETTTDVPTTIIQEVTEKMIEQTTTMKANISLKEVPTVTIQQKVTTENYILSALLGGLSKIFEEKEMKNSSNQIQDRVDNNTEYSTKKPILIKTVPLTPQPSMTPLIVKTNPTILDSDYHYDYVEQTLPPSLPNLKIIPFLPTDAVKDDRKKINYNYYKLNSANTEKYDTIYASKEQQKTDYEIYNTEPTKNDDKSYIKDIKSDYSIFSLNPASYPNEQIYGVKSNPQPSEYDLYDRTSHKQYPSITENYDQNLSKYGNEKSNIFSYDSDYDYSEEVKYEPHEKFDSQIKYVQNKYDSSDSINNNYNVPSYAAGYHKTENPINRFSPPTKTEGGFLPREPTKDNSYYYDSKYHTTAFVVDLTTEAPKKHNLSDLINVQTTSDPFKDVIRTEPSPDLHSLIEDKEKLIANRLSEFTSNYSSLLLLNGTLPINRDFEKDIISITTDSNYNLTYEYLEVPTNNLTYETHFNSTQNSSETLTDLSLKPNQTNITDTYEPELEVQSSVNSTQLDDGLFGGFLSFLFKDDQEPVTTDKPAVTNTIPPFKTIPFLGNNFNDLPFIDSIVNKTETTTINLSGLDFEKPIEKKSGNKKISSEIKPVPVFTHPIPFLRPNFLNPTNLKIESKNNYNSIKSELEDELDRNNPFNPLKTDTNNFSSDSYQVLPEDSSISNTESYVVNPVDLDKLKKHNSEGTAEINSKPKNGLNDHLGILKLAGCNIYGRMYRVGRIISELSGPCLECKCTEVGVHCTRLNC